uniref:DDE_Tnp_1_7 domain-containing protein n=1 Tax=Macrostomum lignano TaxID=282301 RepID=A0A1I8FCZ7_9PLAT
VMQEVRREQVEQAECSGPGQLPVQGAAARRLEAAKTASLSEKARQKTGEAESSSREEETPAAEVVTSEKSEADWRGHFNKPAAAGAAADEAKQKLQAEPGAEATARLNNNNSGMLSDAGIFAYCSLTATALAQLYPEDWHKEFRSRSSWPTCSTSGRIRFATRPTAILRHGQADCSMLPFAEALLTEESRPRLPGDGCYDARARYLLKHVPFAMRISWASLEEWELKTAALLNDPASEAEVVDEAMKRNRRRKVNRLLIGASAVGGGLPEFGLTADCCPRWPPAPASSSAGRAPLAIGTAAGARRPRLRETLKLTVLSACLAAINLASRGTVRLPTNVIDNPWSGDAGNRGCGRRQVSGRRAAEAGEVRQRPVTLIGFSHGRQADLQLPAGAGGVGRKR